MSSLFETHILNPVREGQRKEHNGIPIPLTRLSKVTNYITRSSNIAIGGRPHSGRTSLMDYTYFISVFKWWHDQDEHSRPKIKFFYFNMRKPARMKLQKWLCLCLKLEYGLQIDIPTLNNDIGKLYDLDEDDKNHISSAYDFFTDLENGPMTFIQGKKTPSHIFNTVRDYMLNIGRVDEHDNYHLSEDHLGQYTFVYVDNVDYLLTESDEYSSMTPDMLKRRLAEHMDVLKNVYNTINIVSVPSKATNSRLMKDSEPSYKDLGVFEAGADLGIIAYNPYDEGNRKYCGFPIEELVIRGKNRFRTLTVVTNKQGIENATIGAFFIGECGYFSESPHANQPEKFGEIMEVLNTLH